MSSGTNIAAVDVVTSHHKLDLDSVYTVRLQGQLQSCLQVPLGTLQVAGTVLQGIDIFADSCV